MCVCVRAYVKCMYVMCCESSSHAHDHMIIIMVTCIQYIAYIHVQRTTYIHTCTCDRIECLEAVEDHLPLPTLREESDLLHEDHVHCVSCTYVRMYIATVLYQCSS